MNKSQIKRKSIGFTLIELLVVIAVIAMLLAVITPALRKAKEAAKSLTCRSNLRQMGIGLSTYYLENDDQALYSEGGTEFWFLQLAPYMGDRKLSSINAKAEQELRATMQLVKCPNTKAPLEPASTHPSYFPEDAVHQYRYEHGEVEGSYTMNSWVGGWDFLTNPDWGEVSQTEAQANLLRSFRQKNSNRNRADVPVILDGMWVDTYPEDTDQTPNEWPSGVTLSTGNLYGDIGLGRVVTNRHGLRTNILFCDGHVEEVPLEDMWAQQWNLGFDKQYDVLLEP